MKWFIAAVVVFNEIHSYESEILKYFTRFSIISFIRFKSRYVCSRTIFYFCILINLLIVSLQSSSSLLNNLILLFLCRFQCLSIPFAYLMHECLLHWFFAFHVLQWLQWWNEKSILTFLLIFLLSITRSLSLSFIKAFQFTDHSVHRRKRLVFNFEKLFFAKIDIISIQFLWAQTMAT